MVLVFFIILRHRLFFLDLEEAFLGKEDVHLILQSALMSFLEFHVNLTQDSVELLFFSASFRKSIDGLAESSRSDL